MAVNVLVVDDSGFFLRRLTEILNAHPELNVVGTATNGREAVEKVEHLKPDVITMDYEMPVMDGITAVQHIMKNRPTPILMFSSLTHEGARVTLNALEAGAVDFLPKNFEDISKQASQLQKILQQKVLDVSRGHVRGRAATPAPTARKPAVPTAKPTVAKPQVEAPVQPVRRTPPAPARRRPYKLVAIGTSTGGPVALQEVLTKLPANFPYPMVLIQHMPAAFTGPFAQRLNSQCRIQVKEAQDGDMLKPGLAILAPGGKQMMVDKGGRIKILPGDDRLNYKPCVDVTFGSAAKSFPGDVLAIVLTGMGSDGKEGARMLKQGGSSVWAQDEESCVIYGMPMAVARANLADRELSLTAIGEALSKGGA